MKRLRLFLLSLTFIAASAQAQQRPVPDPRVEIALSTTVVKETQRSVDFGKTIPPSPVRPAVHEPEMAKIVDGVYVDRRWVPARAASEDSNAVRVRPSDR